MESINPAPEIHLQTTSLEGLQIYPARPLFAGVLPGVTIIKELAKLEVPLANPSKYSLRQSSANRRPVPKIPGQIFFEI